MSVYTDYNEFKEAIRSAYQDNWDEIFSYLGISPKRRIMGSYTYYDASPLCHQEKTPSVQEYPTTLYCHGCGESHDIFKVCEMASGKEFKTIAQELGERKGITFEYPKEENKKFNTNKNQNKIDYRHDKIQMIYAVFMRLTHHFLFQSSKSEPFRDYLKNRSLDLSFLETLQFKLNKDKMIMGCGCVPLDENSATEMKKHMLSIIKDNVADSGINTMEDLDEALKIAELINDKGNFKLMGRVVFVCVSQGKVVNVYGRKISDNDDYPKHLYLKLENHGFYNFDDARKNSRVVFAECIIDALSLMQYGIPSISTFGVGGWKSDVCLKLLRTSRINLLIMGYDKDKISIITKSDEYKHHSVILKHLGPAGAKAAIRTGREIENSTHVKVRILDIPYDTSNGEEGKNDINNFIIKVNDKSKEEKIALLEEMMIQAKDVDTTELLVTLEIMTKNEPYYGEQDISEVVMKSLNAMHVVNAHHVLKVVANKFKLPFELLLTYQMMLTRA
jgi:hypothetical protein